MSESQNRLKKLWRKCNRCGHKWLATEALHAKTGCPVCAGQVVTSTNNLAVTHLQLRTEYAERNTIPVELILAGTQRKLWWECGACGFEWQATGASRVYHGTGCPRCAKRIGGEAAD